MPFCLPPKDSIVLLFPGKQLQQTAQHFGRLHANHTDTHALTSYFMASRISA